MKLIERSHVLLGFPQDDWRTVVTYRTDEGEFNVFEMKPDNVRRAFQAESEDVLPDDHAIWGIIDDARFVVPARGAKFRDEPVTWVRA